MVVAMVVMTVRIIYTREESHQVIRVAYTLCELSKTSIIITVLWCAVLYQFGLCENFHPYQVIYDVIVFNVRVLNVPLRLINP